MHQPLRPYSLVPSGFVVVTAVHDTATTTITVRGLKDFGVCPSWGAVARRVHSRYHRRVGDLPLSGRSVRLLVVARRFRCDAVLCGRQIFAERFTDDALARISHTNRRIGSPNQRKLLCRNDFTRVRGAPDADRVYHAIT
jgi:transposase